MPSSTIQQPSTPVASMSNNSIHSNDIRPSVNVDQADNRTMSDTTVGTNYTIIKCNARGLGPKHSRAYLTIPKNCQHGQRLKCSLASCGMSGREFLYCAFCDNPYAKRNFTKDHTHLPTSPTMCPASASSMKSTKRRKVHDVRTGHDSSTRHIDVNASVDAAASSSSSMTLSPTDVRALLPQSFTSASVPRRSVDNNTVAYGPDDAGGSLVVNRGSIDAPIHMNDNHGSYHGSIPMMDDAYLSLYPTSCIALREDPSTDPNQFINMMVSQKEGALIDELRVSSKPVDEIISWIRCRRDSHLGSSSSNKMKSMGREEDSLPDHHPGERQEEPQSNNSVLATDFFAEPCKNEYTMPDLP